MRPSYILLAFVSYLAMSGVLAVIWVKFWRQDFYTAIAQWLLINGAGIAVLLALWTIITQDKEIGS